MSVRNERLRSAADRLLAHRDNLPATPPGGWIAYIRKALSMTHAQLGRRLGIDASTVVATEKREAEDRITIRKLREAADALGCDVHVLVIPRETLTKTIERAARAKATTEQRRVSNSMALEGQRVSESVAHYMLEDRVRELMVRPRELWEHDGR